MFDAGKGLVWAEGKAEIAVGSAMEVIGAWRSVIGSAGVGKGADDLGTAAKAEPFGGDGAVVLGDGNTGRAHFPDGVGIGVGANAAVPLVIGGGAGGEEKEEGCGEEGDVRDSWFHAGERLAEKIEG